MLYVAALFVLFTLALGLWTLWWSWHSFDAVRLLLGRPTSAIDRLAEGPAEVAGVLEVEGPAKASHGAECALLLVEATHEWTTGSGKTASEHSRTGVRTRAAKLVTLRDATGQCTLRLDQAMLLAAPRRWKMSYSEFLAKYPEDADLLAEGVTRGTVTRVERCLEQGGRVLISGLAVVDPEAEPQHYRRGAGATFVIERDPGRGLVAVAGTQTAGALRAGLPAGLLLVCGALMLAYGVRLAQILVSAW